MRLTERIAWALLRGARRSIVGGVVLLSVAFIVFVAWNILVRPEPLRVAADTTLITEPLASDGLPDYVVYLRELERQGVTAENNAAILYWEAMGPSEIPAKYRDAFFAELGCPIPSIDEALQPFHSSDAYVDWMNRLGTLGVDPNSDLAPLLQESASTRQPGVEGHRLLAPWIAKQKNSIDTLVRATKRPRLYSPPPNSIGDQAESVMAGLLIDEQLAKQAILAITTRAALAIQQGNRDEAWSDLTAAHRLASFYDQPQQLVAALVAVDLHSHINRSLIAYLSACETSEEASRSLCYLEQVEEFDGVDDAMKLGDSIMLLDGIIDIYLRDTKALGIAETLCPPDCYVLLRYVRTWLDRYVEVAGLEDRLARRDAAQAIESAVESIEREVLEAKKRKSMSILFSAEVRGELFAKVYVLNTMPTIHNMVLAEDRCVSLQRLTTLAAALRLYRLQTDQYPDSLDTLAPKTLEAIPLDPFTNEPFRYERRGDGFVLYSLGPNGEDDDGSDRLGEFINGDYAPIDWLDERPKPSGPDDLVVRLPIPELELPSVGR